ncbi:MAG: DUF4252 domain-containing protein [Tannerellaceae bacterium]
MKRQILFLLIALCSLPSLSAQNDLYKKYSGKKGVTSVYVSQALLEMMPSFDVKSDNIDISNILSKLTGIYILSSSDTSITEQLIKDSEHFGKDQNYELLMQVKDSGDNVDFFVKKNKSNSLFQEFVMVVNEPTEFMVIQLLGNMTLDDIKNITKTKPTKK